MRLGILLIAALFCFVWPLQTADAQDNALCQENTVSEYVEAGREAYRIEHYAVAVRAFTCALEIDPQSDDAYIGRVAAYVTQGQYDSALAELENFGNYEELEPYLEFNLRASIFVSQANYDDAIVQCFEALALKEDSNTRFILGFIYTEMWNYEAALEQFNRAIETMTDEWSSHNYFLHRGYVYYRLGEIDEARADFETALAFEPDLVEITIETLRDARRVGSTHIVIAGLVRLIALHEVLDIDFQIGDRI
jgi:tetratricopeptide (TPR) repeat protein